MFQYFSLVRRAVRDHELFNDTIEGKRREGVVASSTVWVDSERVFSNQIERCSSGAREVIRDPGLELLCLHMRL